MNIFKKYIALFSLLFLYIGVSFANPRDISFELYQAFIKENLQPQQQLLSGSESPEFPFNIYFSFSSDIKQDKPILLISLNQSELINIFPEFCNFLKFLQNNPPNYPIIVVCSTNDTSVLPKELQTEIGLSSFITDFPEPERLCSIVLDASTFSVKNSSSLIPLVAGGYGNVTHYEYLQYIIKTCTSNYIPYYITVPYFSLYRLEAISVTPRLNFLLENNIPSIGIQIKNHDQCNNVLRLLTQITQEDLEKKYTPVQQWDKQYSIITFFNYTFILSERSQINIFLIISAIIIFYICAFSFINKKTQIHKNDIIRTWFLPFLLIIINLLALYLSQFLCTSIISNWQLNPRLTLIFKFSIALAIFYCIASLQYFFSFPMEPYTYAFIHSLFTAINILVFTTVDLSFIPFFTVQCIIVMITRNIKKPIPLIIILCTLLLPIIPFAISLIFNCSNESVHNIINSNFIMNLAFSFLFIPFQFIFIRMKAHRKTFGKYYTTSKKQVLRSILIPSSILALLLITITIYGIATKNIPRPDMDIQIFETEKDYINIEKSINEKIAYTEYNCVLNSEKEVIKYDIEIVTDSNLPLFEANYPCDILTKDKHAIFNLDEYPPNPFTLTWKSEKETKCMLKINAYLENNSSVIKEIIEIDFSNGSIE